MDTDEIRGTIDRRLLRISQEKNVSSFHSFINSILRELKIRIETPIEPNKELMVCGANGYYIIIILWFYIQKLLSLNYISLVETATNSNNYEAGEDETFDNKQDKVYLPKNISDYLKKAMKSNILVSPDLDKFINNGHISDESKYSRTSSRMSVFAVVLSIITLILSIITLMISICKSCC